MHISRSVGRCCLFVLVLAVAACTGSETPDSDAGVESCGAHADCDDQNACTTDSCSAGLCVFANNAASCDDGIDCTQNDVCAAGVCGGAPVASLCDDANACTIDECSAGQGCVHTNSCP